MLEVDVQYRMDAVLGWLTYKASLITVARVDGEWVAIVYDKGSETLHEVDVTNIHQWEM
jgi:hypothetical protein